MGQMHRFLFSFQLEAWEKWKYGLGNRETEGDCSLFSETLAYLPRHLNLTFKKNYLPSMFTSSEGERWFSIWEGTQLRLSYLPDHMWTLPWTQSEYITGFSCLCNHFVQMVFSLLFCFPWFHRSFITSFETPLCLELPVHCPKMLAETASLLCASYWLINTPWETGWQCPVSSGQPWFLCVVLAGITNRVPFLSQNVPDCRINYIRSL